MLNTASIEAICMGCFTQHTTPVSPCPKCGCVETAQSLSPHQLRPRTILNGKYLLGMILGEGGFGITYIGWDLNLHLKVAIKEYYPNGFVTRETTSTTTVQPFAGSQGDFFIKGRERFVEEARSLARFRSLPGIVAVNDFFQENGTAYIVMEFVEGQTLKDYLAKMGGKLHAAMVFDMMKPVMNSLGEVHKSGMIHRDISPDNIMISNDGQMKLLDFGAAREFAESGNKSLSIMLKPGYAPEEQYRSRGVQGPWTDIYALCATMYKCITGVTPDESSERMRSDAVQPPSQLGISIDPAQEAAMMKGMTVLQEDRWQSVGELYGALYQAQAVPVVAPQPVSVAPPMPAPTTKPAAVVADIVTPKSSAGNKKKFILGGIVTAVIAVMVIVVAAMNGNGGGSIYVPTPHDEGSLSTNSTPSPIDSSPSPNVITAPSPLPQTAHYTRTITLGQFICENTDNRSQQKGWCTKGVEIDDGSVTSPWSAKDFTSSRYLILEFGKEPAGNIDFVWKGDTNDWGWTQTSGLTPQGDKIVIDLHTINGYYQYMRSSELLIYLCYYSDSWDDLPVKDAYFANAQ